MGDMADDFRAMSEAAKQNRAERRVSQTNHLINCCLKHEYAYRVFNDGSQYRVEGIIDIYPTNQRFHILGSGKRGRYKNIWAFLPAVIKKAKDNQNPLLR